MSKKQLSTQRSFTVLILTIVIFSLGILVGNLITNQKVDLLVDITQDLQTKTLSTEVSFQILQENICATDSSFILTEDLVELAERLDFLENELGWDHPRIVELKEQYFIVQARHWLMNKKQVEQCLDEQNENESIILYFYSNRGDCPRCQQQGTVISYLHSRYEGMKVYSFDITSPTPVVQTLIEVYQLNRAQLPAMIINEEVVQGFRNADEIITIIQSQQDNASSSTTESFPEIINE